MMMMICLVTSSSHPHQHSIIPWISVVFIRLSVPSYYARWRQRKLPATANLITSLSPWVVCPASRVSLGGLTAMARSVLRYFFSPFVLLRLLFYFQPKDSNRWLTSGWEIFIGVGCCCFGGGPEPQRQLTPVASKVEKKKNKKTRKETKQKEEQKKKRVRKRGDPIELVQYCVSAFITLVGVPYAQSRRAIVGWSWRSCPLGGGS